ncbi:glutamine--fructose-6-phosphate transaminase (isomerizing), partial [Candidatus Dojkabacteria bacterium]|nr:glutamine--fructose-6-phosphate transaminase (isomerizing) [Candidatus Dojkabacteria bacterium]
YDSWGVAVIDKKLHVHKTTGAIGDLAKLRTLPKSNTGIGHTRWATHGGVTNVNAHPHFSSDESFVLAQNGIVQNYQELKEKLTKKGHKFVSETDTEVIVRLIEDELKRTKTLRVAVERAFKKLTGRNTIIILENSKVPHIIAVRNGSPLVVGKGDKEIFIASDTLSFSDKTDKVYMLDNYDLVELNGKGPQFFNVQTGEEIKKRATKLDSKIEEIGKEGYDHYMLKEITEQKNTILEASSYEESDFKDIVTAIKKASTIYTLGAGGASFAAEQVSYYLRDIAGLRAINIKPYDINSYVHLFKKNDLLIAISQSGETADTIEAIELAKERGVKIASAVNMLGSTITRISDYQFLSRSGPEICVISTKSGSAQVTFGYLLAMTYIGKHKQAKKDLKGLSSDLEKFFNKKQLTQIRNLAKTLAKKEHLYLLGRGQNFEPAIVGALNIKEASYLHAEGFSAGELKHGVIALISKGTYVIAFVSNDEEKGEMLNAIAEVKARGAKVIGIAEENNNLFDEFVKMPSKNNPAGAITNIIPCQLFGYYIAVARGHNPDKPRNLAKSVTVK